MLDGKTLSRTDDPFFRIIENELVIPGLKGEYEILHFSDVHLTTTDEDSTEEDKAISTRAEAYWRWYQEVFTTQMKEPFSEAQRLPSTVVTDKIFEFSATQKPDLLLFTGDLLDYPHAAAERYIKRAFDNYDGKSMYVPGNHDNVSVAVKHFDENIIVSDFGEFSVIGVDDSKMTVSDLQLSQLKEKIGENKPIIVAVHTPIATDMNRHLTSRFEDKYSIDPSRDDIDENGKEFVRLIENCENVFAVLCGHVHGYYDSYYSNRRRQICMSASMSGFVNRLKIHG